MVPKKGRYLTYSTGIATVTQTRSREAVNACVYAPGFGGTAAIRIGIGPLDKLELPEVALRTRVCVRSAHHEEAGEVDVACAKETMTIALVGPERVVLDV